MHLVIFGASGRTGNRLVRQAMGMGHDVTAFVRRPSKLPFSHERLRVIVGDARDRFNVDRAIHHADAVITTIAPVADEPENTLATIVQTIMQSMLGAATRANLHHASFGTVVAHCTTVCNYDYITHRNQLEHRTNASAQRG